MSGGTMHTAVGVQAAAARRAIVAVLIGIVLVLAGCGDDDATADSDTAESAAGGDNGGSVDQSGSGGDVDLDDFPIPAPPGGELVASGALSNSRLLIYPVSDYEAITVFYEEWVAEVAPPDPPPTIARDDADRQFGATLLAPGIGLIQITTLENDGELRLALAVIAPE